MERVFSGLLKIAGWNLCKVCLPEDRYDKLGCLQICTSEQLVLQSLQCHPKLRYTFLNPSISKGLEGYNSAQISQVRKKNTRNESLFNSDLSCFLCFTAYTTCDAPSHLPALKCIRVGDDVCIDPVYTAQLPAQRCLNGAAITHKTIPNTFTLCCT